jgi:hypothetical protein
VIAFTGEYERIRPKRDEYKTRPYILISLLFKINSFYLV